MTAKVLRGLHKEPTFLELIETGETYDFTDDIHVYSSAALNYRNSFFGQAEAAETVVDDDHDEKHEKVLAQMRAIALEQ